MCIEWVMLSNHLSLCHPLLLLTSIFPASGSFPVSQPFTSGGQIIGVSASAPVHIHIFMSSQFRRSVMSNSLRLRGLQHARLPCPSPTPRAFSNSCPSRQWCHLTISSSIVPFSCRLQFFPTSGSCLVSQFFASGGQNIGVSASESVLATDIQDWFPLG